MSPFGILGEFVASLEVLLGLALLAGAVRALRGLRQAPSDLGGHESRRTLLMAAGVVLAGLVAGALPLLHLHFRGMVPEWPGIRCVEGITRIGSGAPGATGWLPTIVAAIEVLKPVAVFTCGAFVILHRIDRRLHAERLAGPVLTILALGGLTAALDGAAALAWLVIPKIPETHAAGCCTEILAAVTDARLTPARDWATPAHLALVVALVIGTAWRRRRPDGARARVWPDLALFAMAAAALPTGRVFASDVAAPLALGLPHHHCVWCLVQDAPESIVAGALLLVGCCAVGWTAAVSLATRTGRGARSGLGPEATPVLRALANTAVLALTGYLLMVVAGWIAT